MARVRAVVDRDLCAGVSMCTQAAPGAFALNDEGLSEYRDDPWPAADPGRNRRRLPMAAITLRTEAAGEP